MAIKVGLKWPSSSGLMLQDLAHLALWVQVQDKIRLGHRISQVSLSVLHRGAKSTLLSHMPTKQGTNPTETMVKAILPHLGLFRVAEWPTLPWYHLLLWHFPLAPVQCHSLLLPSSSL